ncbi:MAG: hypothetical protein IPG06_22680 [Haliea sp.]|nr:hypothetical protein [Haliea sp.]
MAHHKPLHALRALLLLLALLPATLQAQDARTANVALINEKLAHHVGACLPVGIPDGRHVDADAQWGRTASHPGSRSWRR